MTLHYLEWEQGYCSRLHALDSMLTLPDSLFDLKQLTHLFMQERKLTAV